MISTVATARQLKSSNVRFTVEAFETAGRGQMHVLGSPSTARRNVFELRFPEEIVKVASEPSSLRATERKEK